MNFLMFGHRMDYGRLRMNDIINEPNVLYLAPWLQKSNRITELLCRIHFSKRVEGYINLPFRHIWFPVIFHPKIDSRIFDCIIFEENNPFYHSPEFLDYLKKQYPRSRMVFLFTNPIKKKKLELLKKLKKQFDLLITFDRQDAEKFGLEYYSAYYSRISAECDDEPPVDVFFVGANKGRLGDILSVCQKLKENRISCEFYVTEVEGKDVLPLNGIIYNKRLPYMAVLKKIQNAACLLEILQEGQNGFTLRAMEAITYDKKLLTNNTSIIDEPYYKREYISIFQKPENIDIDFIRNRVENINYPNKDKLSPRKLLEFIEAHFEKSEGAGKLENYDFGNSTEVENG